MCVHLSLLHATYQVHPLRWGSLVAYSLSWHVSYSSHLCTVLVAHLPAWPLDLY